MASIDKRRSCKKFASVKSSGYGKSIPAKEPQPVVCSANYFKPAAEAPSFRAKAEDSEASIDRYCKRLGTALKLALS